MIYAKNLKFGKNYFLGVVLIKKILLHIFSFLGGILNGILGVGAGSIALGVMYSLGEEKKAHASVFAFVIPLCIVTIFFSPITLEKSMLSVILGCCTGSVIGTLLIKKLNAKFLKLSFAAIIIFSGIRSFL